MNWMEKQNGIYSMSFVVSFNILTKCFQLILEKKIEFLFVENLNYPVMDIHAACMNPKEKKKEKKDKWKLIYCNHRHVVILSRNIFFSSKVHFQSDVNGCNFHFRHQKVVFTQFFFFSFTLIKFALIRFHN